MLYSVRTQSGGEALIRTILLEIAGPEGREDVMNAGEQLRAEGREQGRAEGLEALRAAVITVMSARQLPLSEAGRARLVRACLAFAADRERRLMTDPAA